MSSARLHGTYVLLVGLLCVAVVPASVAGTFLPSAGASEVNLGGAGTVVPTPPAPPVSDRAFDALGAHPTRFETATGCGDCAYYMQEGASVQGACLLGPSGSCTSATGLDSLGLDVVVPSNTDTTGFELNGYTNTGDWFQSMIGENWCGSGFGVTNEVFDNAGESVYGPCVSSNVSIVAGDSVHLGLYVSASGSTSGEICFTASDISDPQLGYVNCVPQPNGGASPASNFFRFGLPNDYGFFTGPMTELVDTGATSCPYLGPLPMTTYTWEDGGYLTQISPWSDEWDPATSDLCYNTASTQSWTLVAGDASILVADASANSTYGPRWESIQNTSSVASVPEWTFSTDFTLPAPAPTVGPLGQSAYSNVSFHEPIQVERFDSHSTYADWITPTSVLGHCVISGSNEILTCAPTGASGAATIQFMIGESGGYSLRSPDLVYFIHIALRVPVPTASRSSADVGQNVTFSEMPFDNGSDAYDYDWVLPAGCVGSSSTVTCANLTEPGNVTVFVRVDGPNGTAATSAVLLFPVYSDPAVTLPTASRTSADLGQSIALSSIGSGGSGGLSYNWSGLPEGCNGSTAIISCRPTAVTTFAQVTVSVTDSNGWTVRSLPLVLTVHSAPSVSLSVRPTSVYEANKAVFLATVQGGDGNFSFDWGDLPLGCAASTSSVVDCAPSATGTFRVIVTAIDQDLVGNSSTAELHVSPTVLGLPAVEGYALLGTIGLVAVLAGTFFGLVVPSKRLKRANDFKGPAAAERVRQFRSRPTTPRVNRLRSRMQRYGRIFRTKQDRRP
ncbi:MAG: hypothetical protein WA761_00120 [Thermoplasmata archaeon]